MSHYGSKHGRRGLLASLEARQRRRFRPSLQALEDRQLLAIFMVTNALDNGSAGSLRYEIGQANTTSGANTIEFNPTDFATPMTITLTGGELALSETNGLQTITGPAAALKINGDNLGGVFEIDSGVTAKLSGLTITGGSATGDGGGVYNDATLTMTDCTITGNSASGVGGGLYTAIGSTTTLNACTISGNTAGGAYGGGGIYSAGTITLTGCVITGNSATRNGGAIYFEEDTATMTDCTVSGNSAVLGGGMEGFYATVTLTNCTVSGNTATYGGGGLFNYYGAMTMTNTIVAGNNSDIDGAVSGNNNLIGTGGSGGLENGVNGNLVDVANPGLAPLGNYSGPTQTIALLPGSPAIDAGTSTGAPATDQRGEGRVGAVDIGAFESQGFVVTIVPGGTPQTATIGTAFADPLAVTVKANLPIEPVNGGTISFVANPAGNGASAIFSTAPAVVIANGTASVTAAPNNIDGSYTVDASTPGQSVSFDLTNTGPSLSALVVNTTSDSPSPGPGLLSLREAIDTDNSAAFPTPPRDISFDPNVFATAQTITLTNGQLELSETNGPEIITGPAAGVTINANSLSRGFEIDSGVTASLSGFTITGGSSVYNGGGLYNDSGTLTLTDCTITGNTTSADGGGIAAYDGTTILSNSVISNNSSNSTAYYSVTYGGGVFDRGGALTLTDCTVSGNSVAATGLYSVGVGGGVSSNNGSLTLTGCTITGNSGYDCGGVLTFYDSAATLTNCNINTNVSTYFGGGAGFLLGPVTLTNCTISGNTSENGGGLINDGGTMTMSYCTVSANQATYGGGLDSRGTTVVNDSTFNANSASTNGGGVENPGDTLTMVNCTVSGNTAGTNGGGVFAEGTTTLTNCVVSLNMAAAGGGLYAYSGYYGYGTATINNTIVAGNSTDISGTVAGSNNLIGTGGSGGLVNGVSGNLVGVANPGLGPLTYNGGPTETMALLPGSPAIDAGSAALAVDANGNPLTTDQRGTGFARDQGGAVDIGSYEFNPGLSQTVTFGPIADQNYGGTLVLTATDSSDLPITYYILSGPATISGDVLTFTGVGTVVVEAGQFGNDVYGEAPPVYESITVSPAILTITPDTGQSKVYGAAMPTLTGTITGFVAGDTSSLLTGSIGTTATASSGVGTYAFTAGTLSAGPDYTFVVAGSATFDITPATLTITPTSGQSKEYGAAVPALTDTATGFVNGDPTNILTGALGTLATVSSPLGTYAFTLGTLSAGPNYTLSLNTTPTFAVTQAILVILPTPGQSKVYGAAVPTLTETASGFVNGDTSAILTGSIATTATATSPVGTYAYTLGTLSAGPNYTLELAASASFAVTKATLTITATAGQSMVYGSTVPTLTYTATGFVGSDTSSLLTGALGTVATSASGVGTYAFTIGTLSAGRNYGLIISPTPTFTVTPAGLTVIPDAGQSMVYGAPVPTLTETATGFVNNDSASLFTGSIATTATSASPVGTYNFTLGTLAAGPNYTLTLTTTPPSFAVTPAMLTILPTAGQSKVYGAAVPSLTETESGFVNGDSASLVTGSLATVALASSGVGTYAFTLGSLAAGPNYTLSLAATPTFTVTPAGLTITPAAGQSKVYGASVPALKETVTGFVNGDTSSLVTGSLATTATASSGVGTYAFTVGTLSAGPNYTVAFTANPPTFAVTPATLTVHPLVGMAKTYGAPMPTLYETVTGFVNGDSASLVTGALGTVATASSGVGTYAFTVGTLKAGINYQLILPATPTFAVNPAPLMINPVAGQSKVYGAPVPALFDTAAGFVNGDPSSILTGSLGTTATASSPRIGLYSFTLGTLSAGLNYTLALSPQSPSFTVTPATLTVYVTPGQSKVYGALVPAIAKTVTGFVNGDNASLLSGVLTTSATLNSPVGTYGYQLGSLYAGLNYTLVLAPSQPTFAVTPALLVVTPFPGQSKAYGAPTPSPVGYLTGLVNGDTGSIITGSLITTATASSPVGNYTISIGTLKAGPNYILVYTTNPPTFAVTPATLDIHPLAGMAKTYGAPVPALYETPTGFVNGDPSSLLTGALGTTATASSGVGAYFCTLGTLSAGPNYTLVIPPYSPIFTVNPASLVIVANSVTANAGQPLPALTASYYGFVNGDSPANLSTPAIETTSATPASPAGAYPITVYGASSPNYAITEVSGTLTLQNVPTTVVSTSIQSVKLSNNKTVEAIVLVWNAALNPTEALQIANYALTEIPVGSKGNTTSLPISQILYTAGSTTLTIVPQNALNLEAPTFLTINSSGLKDASGNYINSSTPGQPGPNITLQVI